jgi:hypothetical protein
MAFAHRGTLARTRDTGVGVLEIVGLMSVCSAGDEEGIGCWDEDSSTGSFAGLIELPNLLGWHAVRIRGMQTATPFSNLKNCRIGNRSSISYCVVLIVVMICEDSNRDREL